MKAIIKWIENIVIGLLICVIIFLMLAWLQMKKNPMDTPALLGYQPLSILSGSMRPVLEPGDMIFVHSVSEKEKIKKGDIIAYWSNNETLITHRVVKVLNEKGVLKYKTKGDANQGEDQECILKDKLLGKMVFVIPKGGYFSKFVRSKVGVALFMICPIGIIIVFEILDLKNKRKAKLDRR